jgi:hypothetical protein
MATDNSPHICKRGVGLGVPSPPLDGALPIGIPGLPQQRHHRVENAQTGRGTLHGTIRPLALGFEAQMGTALREGRFNGPTLDEWLHECAWLILGAGREVGLWKQAPFGIADKHPAEGAAPAGRSESHTAVPLVTSTSRRRPLDQRPRTRCQGVWASRSPCASCGARSPVTRGRPLGPGRRGAAGTYKAASSRSGATNRPPGEHLPGPVRGHCSCGRR